MYLKRLPACCIDGLQVRRWDSEADRGHHGLIPCGTDHLPLGPLRVVLQYTLLTSIYCYLRADRCTKWMEMEWNRQRKRFMERCWREHTKRGGNEKKRSLWGSGG